MLNKYIIYNAILVEYEFYLSDVVKEPLFGFFYFVSVFGLQTCSYLYYFYRPISSSLNDNIFNHVNLHPSFLSIPVHAIDSQ